MNLQKNDFMWIFIILAIIILIGQIVSLVFLFNIPSKIQSNVDRIEQSANKIDSKLSALDSLNNRVSGIESSLIVLSNKYPPNQTININNMNQEELNRAINNAVNIEMENVKWKINLNFWLESLLSLSFIWYIVRKK